MKTLKKIRLKSISDALSDKEMKLVVGGSEDPDLLGPGYGVYADGVSKPCPDPPYRPCNGPSGTWINGGICCLVPCYGLFKQYGYAVLQGLSRCP